MNEKLFELLEKAKQDQILGGILKQILQEITTKKIGYTK